MGIYYSAIAVLGVRVDPRRLLNQIIIKPCPHPIPSGAAFCPACGKPTEEERTVLKPFCETRYPDEGLLSVESIAGLPLFLGTRNESTGLPDDAFIGFGSWSFDDSTAGKFTPPVDAKERVKEALEPLGLWNENEYGVWAVFRCSY